MIITTYKTDGTKERKAQGYGGGLCHLATAPYEVREIPGTTKKIATAEACEEPTAGAKVIEQEKLKRHE